jgi:hypothetical protein
LRYFPSHYLNAVAGFGVFALASCTGSNLPEYSTVGITPPPAQCDINPQSFSEAESLGSFGEGICTVKNAYRISMMEGVRFSRPAIINCAVANGFHEWMQNVVQPAAESAYGVRVSSLTIAASFACRARNGRRGAKLSEHGFGNAIDVAAFQLADGREINVEQDYYRSPFLKQIRQAACGRFSTVLGPGSDASHRDHLHLDLAVRRSRQAYCR